MGEFITKDTTDPKYVADSKGMTADTAKYFQAVALAGQMGKTVEEVLAFMGIAVPKGTVGTITAVNSIPIHAPAAVVVEEDNFVAEPLEEVTNATPAKVVVPVAEVPGDDKFIVTEIVDLQDATESDLNKLALEEEEEENDWTGKIRVGSKVKIVYQVSASRINWIGKKGKVTRIIGNEAAKVFDVEFQGGKIPKIRLNKKTGKLERGYEKKVIRNTFSEDQIELAD